MNNLLEAAKQASSQRLQALLYQHTGEIDELTRQSLLVAAAEHNRVANLKLLVKHKKMQIEDEAYLFDVAFKAAIKHNQVDAGRFLEQYYEEFSGAAMADAVDDYSYIKQAVKRATVQTLQLLMSSSLLNTENTDMIYLALLRDDLEVFRLFLDAGEKLSNRLVAFVSSDSPKLTQQALRDKNLTEEDLADVAGDYINGCWYDVHTRAIEVLLSDPRATTANYIVLDGASQDDLPTGQIEGIAGDLLKFLAKSPLLDLEETSSAERSKLLEEVYLYHISKDVVHAMINAASYRDSHLELLLLEVAVRQASDVGYYIDWLSKKIVSLDTESKLMIASSITSALNNQPVVHSSDAFTVYRAFFLFCLKRRRRESIESQARHLAYEEQASTLAILAQLQTEGATDEGVILSTTLLNLLLVGEWRDLVHYIGDISELFIDP
ncbi:Hypothetical protein POVR2_LOCUS61 [uncultured virus]|nr:Hypothetical protein POVR2_LOCUS61 [uncultured virus]